MDQSAFRSLLSAPRDPSSSSSGSKKALGGAAPKRGWGIKPKDTKAYEKPKEPVAERPAFAPRATHKRILEEGGYKDRAELRRKGVDDEYKPVEKLLEDFERTAKESGKDEEEIKKQRAYLGGDAEHSILVKGLDYALLAARRAELAQENDNNADEELDELVKGVGKPAGAKSKKAKGAEEDGKKAEVERLGKGFKSIGQKEAEVVSGEKKKKKKKKKVIPAAEPVPAVKEEKPASTGASAIAGPSRLPPTKPAPKPEPVEEEEDIFADAGEYDLNANLPSDEEEEDDKPTPAGPNRNAARPASRSLSRSRSRSRSYGRRDVQDDRRADGRRDSRDRSRSYDERDTRSRRRDDSYSRSRSRDCYDSRPSGREYRRSRSDSRDRFPSRDDRGGGHGDRGSYGRKGTGGRRDGEEGRRGEDRYARRARSPSRDSYIESKRRRYDSPSPPHRRYDDSPPRRSQSGRDRYTSHSPSSPPRRRSYSRSPSPMFRAASPPTRRRRSPSRSTTPPLFATIAPALSRSPSPTSSQEDDAAPRIPRKLAPLQGSAIADVGAFLSYDKDAAKADEKRAKKAAWRAKQGLGPQDGAPSAEAGAEGESEYAQKKREGGERMKANNDYVKIMKKMGEKAGGSGDD